MKKNKGYKKYIRKLYRGGKIDLFSVYELNYDHCFIKLDNYTVYDFQDKCAYDFQTGMLPFK